MAINRDFGGKKLYNYFTFLFIFFVWYNVKEIEDLVLENHRLTMLRAFHLDQHKLFYKQFGA